MDSRNNKYRSGMFHDQDTAEKAYQDALNQGYKKDEISVFMSDATRSKYDGSELATVEEGNKSMEGLAIGGAVGGTVIGAIGAIIALSTTIVVPGIGLVVAGPLAAGLVGAGAGSITGGVLGALIGAGIKEDYAKVYETGIKKGGTVLVVPSRSADADKVLVDNWKKNRGSDIY